MFQFSTSVSENYVREDGLKSSSKSFELDHILTDLLKYCLNVECNHVAEIINSQLDSGQVPDDFKRAAIKSLLKKQ